MRCHLHGAIPVDTLSHCSYFAGIHNMQLLEEPCAAVPVDNTLPLACCCSKQCSAPKDVYLLQSEDDVFELLGHTIHLLDINNYIAITYICLCVHLHMLAVDFNFSSVYIHCKDI